MKADTKIPDCRVNYKNSLIKIKIPCQFPDLENNSEFINFSLTVGTLKVIYRLLSPSFSHKICQRSNHYFADIYRAKAPSSNQLLQDPEWQSIWYLNFWPPVKQACTQLTQPSGSCMVFPFYIAYHSLECYFFCSLVMFEVWRILSQIILIVRQQQWNEKVMISSIY